jgi:hypothetical protein
MSGNGTLLWGPTTKYLHIKSTEQCLASSKLLTPHPPLHPAGVSSPRTKGGPNNTRRAVRGWGVNISEDARHWIGLLQFNPSTGPTIPGTVIAGNICGQWVYFTAFCQIPSLWLVAIWRFFSLSSHIIKYGVRSSKFIWAPCAQLYSLAKTPQPPPPPSHTFGLIY